MPFRLLYQSLSWRFILKYLWEAGIGSIRDRISYDFSRKSRCVKRKTKRVTCLSRVQMTYGDDEDDIVYSFAKFYVRMTVTSRLESGSLGHSVCLHPASLLTAYTQTDRHGIIHLSLRKTQPGKQKNNFSNNFRRERAFLTGFLSIG